LILYIHHILIKQQYTENKSFLKLLPVPMYSIAYFGFPFLSSVTKWPKNQKSNSANPNIHSHLLFIYIPSLPAHQRRTIPFSFFLSGFFVSVLDLLGNLIHVASTGISSLF